MMRQFGEEVVAYIVPAKGSTIVPAELHVWAKAEIASFHCPRHFVVMDAFPLGPTGKVDKGALPDLTIANPPNPEGGSTAP